MAAAAVAAIALLGVEVGHLDHRLNQVTAASAGRTLTAAARSALLDPSTQRITLTGGGPDPSIAAVLVVQPPGAAFLFNQGLPALPPGQTYQLWAMIDDQPISVGVLGADPATMAFSLDTAVATKAFAVTVEPAGGSVAPPRRRWPAPRPDARRLHRSPVIHTRGRRRTRRPTLLGAKET